MGVYNYLFAAFRIIAPREAQGIKQSHTHIRRYNIRGAGHLRERSGGLAIELSMRNSRTNISEKGFLIDQPIKLS